jgi:hypothetical protein
VAPGVVVEFGRVGIAARASSYAEKLEANRIVIPTMTAALEILTHSVSLKTFLTQVSL